MKAKLKCFVKVMLIILMNYTVCSANFVNNREYRLLAWSFISQRPELKLIFQHYWKYSNVRVVDTNIEPILVSPAAWAKPNLKSNKYKKIEGGFLVSVTFRRTGYYRPEPTIYINPLTKQLVGVTWPID